MDRKRLTRVLSFALRHGPGEYGLALDREGWVGIHPLLAALQQRHLGLSEIRETDIESLVEQSDIARFEIRAGFIRARYGHSAVEADPGPSRTPPPQLYHATRASLIPKIAADGLRSQKRRFVHLTSNWDYARRLQISQEALGVKSVILVVDAASASTRGTLFYEASAEVWLCPSLPPNVLSLAFQRSKRDDQPPKRLVSLVMDEATQRDLQSIMQSQASILFDP